MGEALKACYNKYAVFQGRESIRTFWLFMLAQALILFGLFTVSIFVVLFTFGVAFIVVWPLWILAGLAALVPTLAAGSRRLHDANLSAVWLLLHFVPGVGNIVLIVLWCQPSFPGVSRFEFEGSGLGGHASPGSNPSNTQDSGW